VKEKEFSTSKEDVKHDQIDVAIK